MVAVEPMSRDELKQVCTVISTGKPGGLQASVGSMGRAPACQSKYSMEACQKWTLAQGTHCFHASI